MACRQAEHERVKAEEAKAESEQPKAEEVKAEEVEQPKAEETKEEQQTEEPKTEGQVPTEEVKTEEQVPSEEAPKQTERGEVSEGQGTPVGETNQGSEQGAVKHEEAEPFNSLAAEAKKATGEKKNSILGQMRDIISNFAKKNGYAEPVFHLTREDFLNAVSPKNRKAFEDFLNEGGHTPAFYVDGKIHYYVEGCEDFNRDIALILAHESTHADNEAFPENVSTLTHAIENEHSVGLDEALDILQKLSNGDEYEREYDKLEARGKNPNEMLADELIAHLVSHMVEHGESALDEITKNPTLQAVVKRAYKFRENERQRSIRSGIDAERRDNESDSSQRSGSIEVEDRKGESESIGNRGSDKSNEDNQSTENRRVDESTHQGAEVSEDDYVKNHPDYQAANIRANETELNWTNKLKKYLREAYGTEDPGREVMENDRNVREFLDHIEQAKQERDDVEARLRKEYQEQHSDNTKHNLFDDTITESGEVQPLSDEQVSAITEVSDFLGQKLQVVDSAVDKQGRRNNGLYDPNTGTIIISRDTQHPMGFVFGHEATHAVKEMSGGAYQDLHSAVREMMGDEKWKAEVAYKKQLYKDNGIELTDEGAAEEVVADYVGSTLNQGENLKKLAYRLKHPVLSKIRESLTKLLDFFRGKKMTAEGKQVQGMLDTITEVIKNTKADGSQSKVGAQKHSIFDPRFEKGGKEELSPEERLGAEVMYDTLKKAIGDDSAMIDGEVGQRVLDDANKRGEHVRMRMGDPAETFAERQKEAEANRGVVMPGLNDASVKVVNDIPRHNYQGGIAQASREAINAAKKKYVGEVQKYDNYGSKFEYTISGNAIDICLSPKHQGWSVNKGVHLALAEHLDEVINNSIEVE